MRSLPKDMVAQEIGRQLLRSGTSIAANYEEAKGALSREDFAYKIGISFKEARETNLWLRLLKDSGIIIDKSMDAILQESEEIRNILGKSVATARKKISSASQFSVLTSQFLLLTYIPPTYEGLKQAR